MNVCFPVLQNLGLASRVYGHFSCAPEYVVVDMITCEVATISNGGQILRYGTCDPVDGLDGHRVDAIAAGEIGGAMQQKLSRVGIRVFQAREGTIGENLVLLEENGLPEHLPDQDRPGHRHGCDH
ncbi:diguanylate cyclase [Geobacter sp. FeAm09]|uniref:NifB/NifX family molybdenum-iron cluster-binding protein n=1 Tax=Geobacter sp. FeAm09 TaxID=2597769 RepID=UPI0011ED3556|nr:NifB/NifX family molybdenum-iron cluster-binding protein [Geobacter sp. FeAm09]QEM68758.1 diguanylate cyclase [Geobacter sp. FeAm09]